MNSFLEVFIQRKAELSQLFLEHMQMTSAAVLISICIGVPLGIAVTKNQKASSVVIGLANVMQSIPSIGLLAFLVPIVGIGQRPAIIMVIIYALLPIIKNTYIGLTGIAPLILESAGSIGLSKFKTLYKIRDALYHGWSPNLGGDGSGDGYHCGLCRCRRAGVVYQPGTECQ